MVVVLGGGDGDVLSGGPKWHKPGSQAGSRGGPQWLCGAKAVLSPCSPRWPCSARAVMASPLPVG